MLLIRVGGIRNASEILHDQKTNLIHNENKFRNMMSLVNFVPLVKNALKKSNFKELGRLISETWELKKHFQNIFPILKLKSFIIICNQMEYMEESY